MKKLLLGLLVLLGLSTLFTGCNVHASVNVKTYGNYTVYLQNDSSYTISDWYVYDVNNNSKWTFKNNVPENYMIYPGQKKGMSGITGGFYYYVAYKINGEWYKSQAFFLSDDWVVRVYNAKTMMSEVEEIESEAGEPEFKLIMEAAGDSEKEVSTAEGTKE